MMQAKTKKTGQKTKIEFYRCKQCGREMNVIDWLINEVCLQCARKNHRKVIGQ